MSAPGGGGGGGSGGKAGSGVAFTLKPGSKASLTATKLQTFAVGKQKKSRFQKEKEAAEAKKKAAEAEAASLFEEFAASFEGDGGGGGGGKSFVKTGGGAYAPQSRGLSEMEKVAMEMQQSASIYGPGSGGGGGGGDMRRASSGSVGSAGGGGSGSGANSSSAAKKRREMDAFLEEIKQRQEAGGDAGAPGSGMSSYGGAPGVRAPMDDGDPTSTNLYIGYLAPTVTEERLNELFSVYGEIYSIKIMWPRTDEERARRRNCGFVSFWRRGDAEAAKAAMHGRSIEGLSIQVGWGKAISKLARAIGEETKVNDVPLSLAAAAAAAGATGDDPDAITVLGPGATAGGAAAAPGGAAGAVAPASLPDLLASAGLSAPPAVAAAAAKLAAAAAAAAAGGAGDGAAAAVATPGGADATAAGGSGAPSTPRSSTDGASADAPSSAAAAAAAAAKAIAATVVPSAIGSAALAGGFAAAAGVERPMTAGDARVAVVRPTDAARLYLIDRTARYVAKDGAALEDRIIQRERTNPDFAFLTDYASDEGTYYRWRVYAFVMGDRERRWRSRPFQMVPGGAFWVPPRPPEGEGGGGSDSEGERERELQRERERRRKEREREKEEARAVAVAAGQGKYLTGRQLEKARMAEREKGGRLPRDEEERFRRALAALTAPSRRAVREAMGAALDNSECAGHVVELLSDSLMEAAGRPGGGSGGDASANGDGNAQQPQQQTPQPAVLLSRLYLLSDVLHNSAAPVRNATSFRTLLEAALPAVFEALGAVLRGGLGRITAQQVRERVLALLAVWSSWSIYPPLFLTGLEASLVRTAADAAAAARAAGADGVREEDMDRSSLERKARQAGLHVDASMGALELFRRLNHLNAYVKAKAAGRTLGDVLAGGAVGGAAAAALGAPSDSDDSDVDGMPLAAVPQTAAQAAAAAAATALHGVMHAPASGADDMDSDDSDLDGVPLNLQDTPPARLPPPPPHPVADLALPPAAAASASASAPAPAGGSKRARSRSRSSSSERSAPSQPPAGGKKSRWD